MGKEARASFMTRMTRSPTCLEISGLTSLNTSCEFSFKKVLTVSPNEGNSKFLEKENLASCDATIARNFLPRIGSPLKRLFSRIRIFWTLMSSLWSATCRTRVEPSLTVSVLVASTVTFPDGKSILYVSAPVNFPLFAGGKGKFYLTHSKRCQIL